MSHRILSITKLIFVISLLFNLLLCASFIAKAQDLPMDKVNDLLNPKTLGVHLKGKHKGKPIYAKGIIAGRYMEADINGPCQDAAFLNWGEEFHLKKCTYNQPDKKAPKKVKTATVIMLNPEKEVLAKWLVASCMIVKGNTDITDCTVTLAKAVIVASSSQFAIAGIVLEDMNESGIQKAYTFRDGVTVKIEDGLPIAFAGMFGDAENKIAVDPNKKVLSTAKSTDPKNTGPARLQRTSREMYKAYMGTQAKDVAGVKWPDVVRDLYQDAWRRAHNDALPENVERYRNDLMVAKCYSLMGVIPPKK